MVSCHHSALHARGSLLSILKEIASIKTYNLNRWLSEKMDGVRAYWDGKQLLSRQGSPIEAPEEFLRGLPCDTALDGELWMGRQTFEQLMSILKSTQGDWGRIQYCVFDL